MQLNMTTDYAIRALIYLAKDGGSVSTTEISKNMSIPQGYLHAILRRLRSTGMLSVQRGIKGGWRLVRDPAHVTLYEIINVMENTTNFHPVTFGEGEEEKYVYPRLQNVFLGIQHQIDDYLESVTIAQLANINKESEE